MCLLALTVLSGLSASAFAAAEVIEWSNAQANGWKNPLGEGASLITNSNYNFDSAIYLENNGARHTGVDINAEPDTPIYAIAPGEVVKVVRSDDAMQTVIIIRHETWNEGEDQSFYSVYGHVYADPSVQEGDPSPINEPIGSIVKAGSPSHLHFGINTIPDLNDFLKPELGLGWGRNPAGTDPISIGWVDPISYLSSIIYLPQPASQASVVEDQSETDTGQEIECLATALMSEASIGTNEERVAVAWTIFNRVDSHTFPNTICDVVYQGGQYATNQEPTQEILDLATSLIGDRGTDPTGGATHFFSPTSMPKEGEATRGYDVGGGLHEVTGISEKVYFPSWSLTMEPVGELSGVRPAYYIFYREIADGEVALSEEPNSTASSGIDTSIILLFDASGSMADNDKIENAKVAAKNSLATLGPRDEVALIVFYNCNSIVVEQPFTTDWSTLASKIDTIAPTGYTPLYAAKDFAQAYMDENARGGVRRIILLTDGLETCGGGTE